MRVKTLKYPRLKNWLCDSPSEKKEVEKIKYMPIMRLPYDFLINFKTNLYHGSDCPMIANYLIFSTASSFLEGKSDRQFLSVQDFNVFTGIVVETLHIAS